MSRYFKHKEEQYRRKIFKRTVHFTNIINSFYEGIKTHNVIFTTLICQVHILTHDFPKLFKIIKLYYYLESKYILCKEYLNVTCVIHPIPTSEFFTIPTDSTAYPRCALYIHTYTIGLLETRVRDLIVIREETYSRSGPRPRLMPVSPRSLG